MLLDGGGSGWWDHSCMCCRGCVDSTGSGTPAELWLWLHLPHISTDFNIFSTWKMGRSCRSRPVQRPSSQLQHGIIIESGYLCDVKMIKVMVRWFTRLPHYALCHLGYWILPGQSRRSVATTNLSWTDWEDIGQLQANFRWDWSWTLPVHVQVFVVVRTFSCLLLVLFCRIEVARMIQQIWNQLLHKVWDTLQQPKISERNRRQNT